MSQKKIEQANQRRLKQMQEKQEASNLALAQKEAKKERQIDIEEAKLKVKEKALNSKILQANLRKEEMLLEKSTTLEANHTKKMERAIMAKKIELEESAALGKEVERKLKIASARKAKITNDTMKEMHDRHKNKVEKIEQMLSKQELKEMQQYIDIENKIASASAKRQEKLGEIAKSSSKKRVSSPKPSPNKSEIDARINKAAARREMYLLTKIDKATSSSSKKLSPRSDLFAKVTPRLGDNGSNGTISPRASPRIKAARLENYSDDKPYQHENVGGFSMMPVIAVSAIALAFVGIASFWKH